MSGIRPSHADVSGERTLRGMSCLYFMPSKYRSKAAGYSIHKVLVLNTNRVWRVMAEFDVDRSVRYEDGGAHGEQWLQPPGSAHLRALHFGLCALSDLCLSDWVEFMFDPILECPISYDVQCDSVSVNEVVQTLSLIHI